MQDFFVKNTIADKLISAHDGDIALLYIYISATGCRDLERAAHDLCLTMNETSAAYEKLQRMGLFAEQPTQKLSAAVTEPARELPQYRAEDLVRRSKEDSAFAVILLEAAKVIGHSLSSNDMKMLFGIYDYLALPAEVILELLNYCAEVFQERYGDRRRPSPRAIEKEAYVWANNEILTLEQAEDYIRAQKDRRSRMGQIKVLLNIYGRELSTTEAKYVSSWIDMGFCDEMLSIALDRTITNTGGLKWGYMNKILTAWQEKGIRTVADIEEKDSRRKKVLPKATQAPAPVDMDELRRILDKI